MPQYNPNPDTYRAFNPNNDQAQADFSNIQPSHNTTPSNYYVPNPDTTLAHSNTQFPFTFGAYTIAAVMAIVVYNQFPDSRQLLNGVILLIILGIVLRFEPQVVSAATAIFKK